MKRTLAFLLLLAAGFAALWFALGDESAVRSGPVQPVQPGPQEPPQQPTNPGVMVQQGRVGAMVSMSGPFELPRWREIRQPDGSIRKEEVYVLKAADSKPLGQGLQQLDRVELRLFDDGRHVATMTASQAFVQLRADATGKTSIDEGQDLDLRDVVLTTLPGSRFAGLRLELGNAKVKVAEDEIQIDTPRDQPVLAVLEGEQRATLRGKGAQALLPRNRDSALRRADLEILQDPVLETGGLVAKARGRLHYAEDLDTGAGRLTLDDDVECRVDRGQVAAPGRGEESAGDEGKTATLRGDQLLGWLQRERAPAGGEDKGQRSAWRQLVLTGAPAVVELPGLRLTTPRITVLPGLLGEPFLLTTHGGESVFEQTERRPGSKLQELLVGRGARRVHTVRPGEHVGALHRAFGFPRWSMRPLEELQVVIGEGPARLASGSHSLAVGDGVRIYRRDGTERGVVRGLGPVRVELPATKAGEPPLIAVGNDGFTLTATAANEALREVLQLGPPTPPDPATAGGAWRDHVFDVRQGDAVLRGRGVCAIERTGERTTVHLFSPDAATTATWPQQGLALQRVRELRAGMLGKELTDLDVAGWPTEVTFDRGGERIEARAPRLLQTGPRSLRLLPAADPRAALWSGLPEVDREPVLRRTLAARDDVPAQHLEVRGPAIDVHHAGGRDVLVDAMEVAGERPRVYAQVGQAGGSQDTTVACVARRLRVLPFVLSPEVRRWLTGGEVGPLPDVAFHALARGWLLVDDVQEVLLDDPRHGHVEGSARQLLVSHGGRAALFVGDPDAGTPAEVRRTHDGRTVTLRGARVRVLDDDEPRFAALGSFADRSLFLPPSLTLHTPGRTGLLSHMQASCQGNIDVLPGEILFGGPVLADTLTADGSVDPSGMHLAARELRMERLLQAGAGGAKGDVVRVVGKQVEIDWTRLRARCAEVELDVRRSRCVASDPDEAVVLLPDGREVRSPRIELNYETMAMRTSRGRVSRKPVDEGAR